MTEALPDDGAEEICESAGPVGLGLDYGGLEGVIGLHLRMAQSAVHRTFMEMLAPLQITQKQAAALWLIEANPGVSQIQIATALRMDRATMMAIVDRLDARGLVDRRRSKADRRRQELQLTEAGLVLLARAKELIAAHEEGIKVRVGKRELEGFIAALKRIAG